MLADTPKDKGLLERVDFHCSNFFLLFVAIAIAVTWVMDEGARARDVAADEQPCNWSTLVDDIRMHFVTWPTKWMAT